MVLFKVSRDNTPLCEERSGLFTEHDLLSWSISGKGPTTSFRKWYRHNLNSLSNKDFRSLKSNLLLILVVLAHKTFQTHNAPRDFFIFYFLFSYSKHYGLTYDKNSESKIWSTHTYTNLGTRSHGYILENNPKFQNLHFAMEVGSFETFGSFEALWN